MCNSLFDVHPVNQALASKIQHKIDRKTKPIGSLGQIEAIALQIALIQETLEPSLNNPHFVVFAGDHGAAKQGVSAFPQEVTWQMVQNFLAGGAAINVFARQNGIALKIVDAGVAHDFDKSASLIDAKIAYGTQSYIEAPAMTRSECETAMARGAQIVRAIAAEGGNIVGFGEMGIGNTASASLITHCLTGVSLAECVGRGTGLDDTGLQRKRQLLEKALARTGIVNDPMNVLMEFGGFEIAMMVGAMLAAAQEHMVVLIDGFIVGSAALVAMRLVPAFRDYGVFCHRSVEPGHRAQLDAMKAKPLMDLDLRLGEGTGAALAYPLVLAAVNFLNQMASFESAGVSDKE